MTAELVLYTRADAMRAKGDGVVRAGSILGLTPNARAAAAGLGLPLIDPLVRYDELRQARDVARVVRVRRRMFRNLGPLPPVERELAIDQFNRVAYSALRLWHTLGERGPWLVPNQGRFIHVATREDAYARLLDHVLRPKARAEHAASAIRTPPWPALYRTLRRLALWRHPSSDLCLAIGMAKEQFGLFGAFEKRSIAVRSLFIGLPQRGVGEYAKLAREILRATRPVGLVQVSLAPRARGPSAALSRRIIGAVVDPVIEPALAQYESLMAARLGYLASARADARRIFDQAKPDTFTAAEISTFGNWIVAEAAGEVGVPRVVMSRNALAPADRMLARDSCIGYLRARYPKGLVDEPLFWSPSGARAGVAARRAGEWSRMRPFRIPAHPLPPPEGPVRTILFADTFAAWWFPHSWVFLNGDEILRAMRALADAVSEMPDTRLIIRAKPKPECDLDALVHHVRPARNCEIKMRDVPISEDLRQADLLVSFRSTVIEEAILARRPILLWGGTNRHRFVESRTAPPRGMNDRGVVYSVNDPAELGTFIQAILNSHARRPLTDAEVAPYCWDSAIGTVDDLAGELVNRTGRRTALERKEASLAAR